MKAHISLCKCVDSPEPLLPAYTTYRCRQELRPMASLRQHGQLMVALPICHEYQNLTCWSNLYLSTLYTQTKKKRPIFMVLYLSIQLRCRNKNKTTMFIKRRTHNNWYYFGFNF